MTPPDEEGDEQPRVEHWPMWDEPLSKITAPLDIEQARRRLARGQGVGLH